MTETRDIDAPVKRAPTEEGAAEPRFDTNALLQDFSATVGRGSAPGGAAAPGGSAVGDGGLRAEDNQTSLLLTNPFAGQDSFAAVGGDVTRRAHIVNKGETLSSISRDTLSVPGQPNADGKAIKKGVDAIVAANPGLRPNALRPGQSIEVPDALTPASKKLEPTVARPGARMPADAGDRAAEREKFATQAAVLLEGPRAGTFDPSKPRMVVLDDFMNRDGVRLHNGDLASSLGVVTPDQPDSVSHGEFSARLSEDKFNVFRVQHNVEEDPLTGRVDFSKSLNSIYDQIKNGKLVLGPGDVINVSMGNNPDISIEALKDVLGLDNLTGTDQRLDLADPQADIKTQKEEIMKRVAALATDASTTPENRAIAQQILDTNAAITKLQDLGITVVHAGGNSGSGIFSPDFMNANVQLASARPSGVVDGHSANTALLQKADGALPIVFDPAKSVFRVPGFNAEFPASAAPRTQFGFSPDRFGTEIVRQTNPVTGDQTEAVRLTGGVRVLAPGATLTSNEMKVTEVSIGTSFVHLNFWTPERVQRLREIKEADARAK